MGYYTKFELEVKGTTREHNHKDWEEEIALDSEYGGGGLFEEPLKWYGYQADMEKFSKKYPDALFILKGEGEESGDIWKQYFQNGKSQRAKAEIIFEEFDPLKLR